MEIATTTIPVTPVPAQMIIIGASAVFGRAFKITRNGSNNFVSVRLDHKITAIKTPVTLPIITPKTVSSNDI